MSRVAKAPVALPQGVTSTITADAVVIKGPKGSLSLPLRNGVVGGAGGQHAQSDLRGPR
jgi:Ribosomal protein L6P/L9E